MKASDVTAGLIFLPRNFHRLGNVSPYELLNKAGYFVMHDQVSEASIHEALKDHPECVDEWMIYSEDKRASSGWYFKQEGKDTYIVGHFVGKTSYNPQLKFTDRITACAAFIKRESEAIRCAG